MESNVATSGQVYAQRGIMLARRPRSLTHGNGRTRQFTATNIVKNWSAHLDRVMLGLVFFEASGMTQFGRTSVCIDKRSGKMVVSDW